MNKRNFSNKQIKYSIKANIKQKKNFKLIDCFKKRIEYDPEIKQGDFIVGENKAIFYLAYKYHTQNIKYLDDCILPLVKLNDKYYNILLFVIDCNQNEVNNDILRDINLKLFNTNAVLIVAQSHSDAAHYIEEFGVVENKEHKETVQMNERSQIINAMSMVKGFNSQNIYDLLSKFITLKRISVVEKDEIKKSKNVGPKKVENLWKVLHSPFIGTKKTEQSIQTFLKSLTIEKKKSNSKDEIIIID